MSPRLRHDGMTDTPIPAAVRTQAAEWLVALQAEDVSDETRALWRQWRKAHPDHERAWHRIESFGQTLQGLPPGLAQMLNAPVSPRRRQAIKALACVLFVGGAAWVAEDSVPWRLWVADKRTGTGERADLTLQDGTLVQLDASSAVEVLFDAEARMLRLLAGEIMVTTASDPMTGAGAGQSRPFIVQTAQGRLRALGTRFSVSTLGDEASGASRVSVFEGAVEIRPRLAPDAPLVLRAGEQGRLTRDLAETGGVVDESAAAWTRGMILAQDMPLEEFLTRLGRYRAGWLVCDPAVAHFKVTGTYPLADSDLVLDVLAATLPIRVQFVTRYWAAVRPAD